MKNTLIRELQKKPAVYAFLADPIFNSQLISFIIQHEIGTYRDQLFDVLYDTQTEEAVTRDTIRVESLVVNNKTGLSVWVEDCTSIGIRIAGFKELLNPQRSFNNEKQILRCVFFPESIAKIAALQEVELVIVRDWAIAELEAIDKEYDPIEERTQAIRNRDALTFADLLESLF